MPAQITNGRPLSLKVIGEVYGLAPTTIRNWERAGVDVLEPIQLFHAMGNNSLSRAKGFPAVFGDYKAEHEENILWYCRGLVSALEERGLDPAEHLAWFEKS